MSRVLCTSRWPPYPPIVEGKIWVTYVETVLQLAVASKKKKERSGQIETQGCAEGPNPLRMTLGVCRETLGRDLGTGRPETTSPGDQPTRSANPRDS